MTEPEVHAKGAEKLASTKFILTIVMWAGPIAMGVLAGYGSAKFTSGAGEQRLTNVERKAAEIETAIERLRDRYITREELKAYLDGQKDTLREIQADLRALRSR